MKEPAFPHPTNYRLEGTQDMTLRDYFAEASLQGMRADPDYHGSPLQAAMDAYADSDAMISERAK